MTVTAPAPQLAATVPALAEAWALEAELADDPAVLAAHLRAVRQATATLAILDDCLAARLARLAPSRHFDAGGILIEVQPGGRRTRWDHTSLIQAVAAHAIATRPVDPATGETTTEAQAVLAHLRACAAINYWRVGELRARGINPNRHSSYETTRPRIILP